MQNSNINIGGTTSSKRIPYLKLEEMLAECCRKLDDLDMLEDLHFSIQAWWSEYNKMEKGKEI